MTLTPGAALASILVMAAATFITRLIPFALFSRGEIPKTVLYMGKALPPAVIAMLVVYCFRNIDLLSGSRGIPELCCALVVVLLHLWRRNNLLSIFGGTVLYMLIIQNLPL